MNAIILAAGRGSRMKKLTECNPKCMVQLGGKSLLQWQTEALDSAGVSNISIVRGYLRESLVDPRYRFFDNPKWERSNMVYSLTLADPILKETDCLISYSDIVYHKSIVSDLIKAKGDIVIAYDQKWENLWRERFKNLLEDAETFESRDGRLVAIGEKAKGISQIKGQYMGLFKISPNGWKKIMAFLCALSSEEIDKLDMTSLLNRLLRIGVSIATIPAQGKWCEVDSEEDLLLYERKLLNPNWTHDWR